MVRRITFGEPMTVNVLSSRRVGEPFGVDGGANGRVGVNRVIRTDGTTEELPASVRLEVGAGDSFEIETPGGGGHGAS